MSTQENKTTLQYAVDSWNSGNLEGYLQLYESNSVIYGAPTDLRGVEAIRQFYSTFWAAFPGNRLHLEDILAEGDKVACSFSVRGVHRGEFLGLSPTGKEVRINGITILRFAAGKCVERWNQADFLGLMQQLGAIPTPDQAG